MSLRENYSNVAQADFSSVPNIETALAFVDTYHTETNRKPNEFLFWVDKDGLVDPNTNKFLHDIHSPERHFVSYLGIVEYDVIQQLDKLSRQDSGYLIWDSPMFRVPGGYPSHKFEVMKITKSPAGQKKVENVVIVFDCSNKIALQIAQELFSDEFKNSSSVEDVRKKAIYRDQNFDIDEVIKKISEYLPKNENYVPMKDEDKFYIATLMIQHRSSEFIAQEMMNRNILGEHSITCPPGVGSSFSDSLTQNSSVIDLGWHFGTCRKCGLPTLVGGCNICQPCVNKYFS